MACGDLLLHTVVLSQGGVTASGHSRLSPFFLQDMKAKKETPQELLLYFFGFIFFIFLKLINCAYFIHNRFSIHSTFKQKYTVTVKDAVLSIKYLLYSL